jgi:hypothetical protein
MIELILTIVAWRKGWGALALLPMAVGVTIGVLAAGMSNSIVPAAIADMLIYGVLIAMIVAGRKKPAMTQSPALANEAGLNRPAA